VGERGRERGEKREKERETDRKERERRRQKEGGREATILLSVTGHKIKIAIYNFFLHYPPFALQPGLQLVRIFCLVNRIPWIQDRLPDSIVLKQPSFHLIITRNHFSQFSRTHGLPFVLVALKKC
jgi:hypothetical protein